MTKDKTWEYKDWRYPAGEWNLEMPGGRVGDFANNVHRFMDVLANVLPPLSQLHQLEEASIDISIPGDMPQEDQTFPELNYFQNVNLNCQHIREVIPAVEQLTSTYPRYFIARVRLDLGTQILANDQLQLIAKSAALFFLSDYLLEPVGKEINIFVSYETYIDIWLDKTYYRGGGDELRDNSQLAGPNRPRLQQFLQSVMDNLGVEFKPGESVEYQEYLRKDGFALVEG